MEYSKEIIKAYKNWMKKSTEVPATYTSDWYKKYKAEMRAENKFEKLCAEANLDYIQTACDLTLIKTYIPYP